MSGKTPNLVLNFEEEPNQYLTMLRAHDSIHPEREECGGVGGCRLLFNEATQEQELTERYLPQISSSGYRLRVTVDRKEKP